MALAPPPLVVVVVVEGPAQVVVEGAPCTPPAATCPALGEACPSAAGNTDQNLAPSALAALVVVGEAGHHRHRAVEAAEVGTWAREGEGSCGAAAGTPALAVGPHRGGRVGAHSLDSLPWGGSSAQPL